MTSSSVRASANAPLLGIALNIGASLSFMAMYACVKQLGDFPVGETVFFRGLFSLAPLFVLSYWTIGAARVVRTAKPLWHMLRSIIGIAAMFCFFAAVTLVPLATVTALAFMQPLFAVALAALLLREGVGLFRGGAVAVGFVGVIFMLQPTPAGYGEIAGAWSSLGVLLVLLGAFLGAVAIIVIRRMSASESSETIVFYYALTCVAAGAATMLWQFEPLNPVQFLLLCGVGIFGGINQICVTFCYRFSEPSMVAPFDYFAMIWAVAIGYFLFQEIPTAPVLWGASLVVAAGIVVAVRQRRIDVGQRA